MAGACAGKADERERHRAPRAVALRPQIDVRAARDPGVGPGAGSAFFSHPATSTAKMTVVITQTFTTCKRSALENRVIFDVSPETACPLKFQPTITISSYGTSSFVLDAGQGDAIRLFFWMRGAPKSYARATHCNGVDGNKRLP